MVTVINRMQLQRLVAEEDAQIVDVLPEREFSESHIPGAVNVPLKKLNPDTVAALRRDKPVVVY